MAALALVPLVEVAWADGQLDRKERGAILERAKESGIGAGSMEHALLEAWLDRRPDPKLLTAWTHLVRGVGEQLEGARRPRASGEPSIARGPCAVRERRCLGLGSEVPAPRPRCSRSSRAPSPGDPLRPLPESQARHGLTGRRPSAGGSGALPSPPQIILSPRAMSSRRSASRSAASQVGIDSRLEMSISSAMRSRMRRDVLPSPARG